MTKLINTAGQEIEVPLNENIIEQGKELGVPFSCEQGICGTCRLEILEGEGLLNDLTEEEQAMGDRDKKNRLCCQMKIVKDGNVKLKV